MKTTKTSVPMKIQTEHFPHISLDSYFHSDQFGVHFVDTKSEVIQKDLYTYTISNKCFNIC
jgi:hypothetical protein